MAKLIAKPSACRRCGGLRREWIKEHRRHAGFSYHRICCCASDPVCDPASKLQLTISGVDASFPCVTCDNISTRSLELLLLNVDGVYIVDYLSSSVEWCECVSLLPISGGAAQTRFWSLPDCTGTPTIGEDDFIYIKIVVMKTDPPIIGGIQASPAKSDGKTGSVIEGFYFVDQGEDYTFGGSIPNGVIRPIPCGLTTATGRIYYSTTGTAVVDLIAP